MTLSEIARYWTAKNLTGIEVDNKRIFISAPFGVKEFTVRLDEKIKGAEFNATGEKKVLERRNNPLQLDNWTYFTDRNESILCFSLPKGKSEIVIN